MPNGKPGDHPFTDILIHGRSEYGDPVDAMVKEMAKHPRFSEVRDQVAEILWDGSPLGQPETRQQVLIQNAIERLKNIQQEMES